MGGIEKIGRIHPDKRREDRIYDNIGITIYVVLGRGFKTQHDAAHEVTIDISEGGLRFYDEWGVPENAHLEIVMQPYDNRPPIVHFGQVRWKSRATDREGYEIGVMFTEASSEDREAWLNYVSARRNKKNTARIVIKLDPRS